MFYVSAQNDSLRQEFLDLIESKFAPSSFPFGDEVFGKECDAANLWIGNQKSVSVVHRDTSYENMYCVLKGQKVFHLLPPCVAPFMGECEFLNARHEKDWETGKWKIELEKLQSNDDGIPNVTPWIELDVADPEAACKICPEFAHVKDMILRVEVNEGECLYLPAGWYHRVTQTRPTLAVNYWYDREFNATWALQEALEGVVKESRKMRGGC